MKHALALMTLFLVLLLMITTVMAVGNSKQAQQMAQRAQLISSLRTELRQSQQDMQALDDQLTAQRAAAKALRTERDALNLRYARLTALLESPVEPDRLLSNPSLTASSSRNTAQPLPGESWLQAEALQQALLRVEQTAVPTAGAQPDATPAEETLSAQPATASAHPSALTPALVPSASPAAAENALPDPTAIHEAAANGIALVAEGAAKARDEVAAATPKVSATPAAAVMPAASATPSITATPTGTATPAVTMVPTSTATPTLSVTPTATPSPTIATVAAAQSVAPSATVNHKAQATTVPADTDNCEPCFPFHQPPPLLTEPLLRGLKTAQHILQWLEEAVDDLVHRLSSMVFPLS